MKNKVLPLETFIGKTKREGKIPDKLYFRISEVSKLTGLEPYVLRYWGSEFKSIKPIRTKSRHRLYRRRDLEVLFEIKKLLYEEKYTIAGAKKQLEEIAREEKKGLEVNPDEKDYKKILHAALNELKALRKLLAK
jgi:DNA-binding transcriptional MerR regulator